MTAPQDLPVLWTRPEDCICDVVLVHGGGLYRIARTVDPVCTDPHLDQHPHGLVCSYCASGKHRKCDGDAWCDTHDALDHCTCDHPKGTP